ncbi:ATP-grasp domain-containing protein [Glycomyces harbinensis]|uniref:Cysteine synthase A n=1 Tax=Glycomyces harbinensis TaxID=58114 RepID=A0A1G7AAP7_9ACTN|nr:ATP-grasp domain-containing protein [Glycomyces harbinensis]SDE12018.1 cysteine synthase A [Glycomyces harbinensis]
MKRLLLVAPLDSGLLGVGRIPVDLTVLQTAERVTDHQRALARVVVTDDFLAEARRLHAERPFDGVLAMNEHFLLDAGLIADDLCIAGTSREVVRNAMDKSASRRLAEGTGLANPRYRVVRSAEDLASGYEHVGFPCVAKPLDKAGSEDVRILHAPADRDVPVLLEEYVGGTEFCVDALSRDGVHDVLPIAARTTRDCVELAHDMPADLPEETVLEVHAAIGELLDAIGYRSGASHTEFKIDRGRLWLIETHTRCGGDWLWEMAGLITGRFAQPAAVAALAGVPEPVWDPVAAAAAVEFLTAPEGTVTGVSGLDAAAGMDGVVRAEFTVGVGDRVTALNGGNGRLGYVLTVADTAREARERARKAIEAVTVTVA